MNDNIFPSLKAVRLGEAIYSKLLDVDKLLSQFDKDSKVEKEEIPYVLHFLGLELETLYDSVSNLLKEDDFEIKRTYDKLYAHPRFKRDSPLEVILSYTYLMVSVISKNAHYQLIEDSVHQMYANALMNKNHSLFAKYVALT